MKVLMLTITRVCSQYQAAVAVMFPLSLTLMDIMDILDKLAEKHVACRKQNLSRSETPTLFTIFLFLNHVRLIFFERPSHRVLSNSIIQGYRKRWTGFETAIT